MRILVVDKFEDAGVAGLRQFAAEVAAETGLKGEALAKRVGEFDPDVLVVRSTKIPRDTIEAAKRLKLIVRAGSGVDNIDVPAASQRGVQVANCPGQNAVAVAELTIGLMIALDRHIPDNVSDQRAHKWNKSLYAKLGLGLKGKTIGIVGAGKIGTEVARRALAFDMRVLYYHLGRNQRLADFPTARRTELDELLRESDVVSLHVPGGENTNNLLDARRIGLMKPTALLINTARGGVVDEKALVEALGSGRLRGAALDVLCSEPTADAKELNSPLCEVPNLYITHHIGASTEQAQLAVAEEAVRIVREFKQTGRAPNTVNMRAPERSVMLVVRLRNEPGGLAHVFTQLAGEEINVEEMDHVIYDGGKAACAHIRVSREPSPATLERLLTGHRNVLGVEVTRSE